MADADLLHRLDQVEARLNALAAAGAPEGLTEPDEGGEERWEAAQVWGHLSEFPTYWLGELRRIVTSGGADPVPFGRTKEDQRRLAAIDGGRAEPIPALLLRVTNGITDVRAFLTRLDDAAWSARGRHARRGEMDVREIVESFIVAHLEEHADQLERLEARAADS